MPTDADAFLENVAKTLRNHRMITPGERVLVALSGGPDSVCLLHALHELGLSVAAAHLNHGTRGADSDADAALARKHAETLGVPYHEERMPVAEQARREGRNFHEYAREVRYLFLQRAARLLGCAAIATGHHADDQAETVLMRVVRGTGPRGLAGIPPVRDEGGVRVIRPLFDCRRADILAYLQARNLEWREDASNRQSHYLRGRVRHQLVPLLEAEFNPGARDALVRLGDAMRVEDDFLSAQAQAFLNECLREGVLDRAAFAKGHRALQRRAVLALMRRYDPEWPFERVDEAVGFITGAPSGKAFHCGNMWLLNAADTTDFGGLDDVPELHPERETPLPLAVPGETLVHDRLFRARLLDAPPAQDLRSYCRPDRQVFDAEAAVADLAVRHWRPGDRFTPLGMAGSRKIQDYFTDLKLSARERHSQLILTAGGRILWVVGRAVDARAAVTPRTQRVLEVEVSHAPE